MAIVIPTEVEESQIADIQSWDFSTITQSNALFNFLDSLYNFK